MSKTARELNYVFLDIETTGTDEAEDNILEVGMVITDADLQDKLSTSVILQDYGNKLAKAATVVQDMHAANGLANAVADGMPRWRGEQTLIDALRPFGKPHDFVMAGSGVAHFDRRFIARQMPELNRWFRYYCIDVGILRRTLTLVGRADLLLPFAERDKTHRALDDAKLHLTELLHVKAALS